MNGFTFTTDQYSLLVQNKGKSPLAVSISAPDYVQLQKTEIQLQSKEDKEVFLHDTMLAKVLYNSFYYFC